MLDHAKILGIENVSTTLILINRHILPRSRLFHNGILPAARMCAGPLIGISPNQEIAEKTTSGIGNTHCSVNESLNLHIIRNIGTYLANLLQRKLTCSYHALRPKIVPETVGFVISVICLSADVALDLRANLLGIGKNTRISYDQGVRF